MYQHEIHAKCENGHKRNFTYIDDKSTKLKKINDDYCAMCRKKRKFIVVKYLTPIEKITMKELIG